VSGGLDEVEMIKKSFESCNIILSKAFCIVVVLLQGFQQKSVRQGSVNESNWQFTSVKVAAELDPGTEREQQKQVCVSKNGPKEFLFREVKEGGVAISTRCRLDPLHKTGAP
jgi:hypothetical protein